MATEQETSDAIAALNVQVSALNDRCAANEEVQTNLLNQLATVNEIVETFQRTLAAQSEDLAKATAERQVIDDADANARIDALSARIFGANA